LAGVFALIMLTSSTLAQTDSTFVRLDPANTASGYLARLLINEVPFPGERAYVSEAETQGAMVEILGVLHSRLRQIPAGYRQEHVAGVRSADIIDIICGTGEKRQCEGFYRNDSGQFVVASRVEERLNYLIKIANSGGKPGRFANLLNFGQGLARAYALDKNTEKARAVYQEFFALWMRRGSEQGDSLSARNFGIAAMHCFDEPV
jgi:hypothetical protein